MSPITSEIWSPDWKFKKEKTKVSRILNRIQDDYFRNMIKKTPSLPVRKKKIKILEGRKKISKKISGKKVLQVGSYYVVNRIIPAMNR